MDSVTNRIISLGLMAMYQILTAGVGTFAGPGDDLFLVEWAVEADSLGFLLGPAQFSMYAMVTTLGLMIDGPWSSYVPAAWCLFSCGFWAWVVIKVETRRGWPSYGGEE